MAVVLSKRERSIGIVTGVVVSILLLDWVAVEPLLAQKDVLDSQIAKQRKDLDRANQLFRTSRTMNRRWAQLTTGQLQHNASQAESQVQNAVRVWAQDSGLTLSSVTPARADKEKDFQKITFRAAVSGGMAQVARFLYRIEYADIPVRVTDLQLARHPEGGASDELTLSLGLTPIYQPPREGQQ